MFGALYWVEQYRTTLWFNVKSLQKQNVYVKIKFELEQRDGIEWSVVSVQQRMKHRKKEVVQSGTLVWDWEVLGGWGGESTERNSSQFQSRWV